MSWPELTVTSWEQFTDLATKLSIAPPLVKAYFYRGQSQSKWPLDSSLSRIMPKGISTEAAIGIEKKILAEFQSQAHLYVQPSILPRFPSDYLGWWIVMQHHGAPTRLLDFTASIYVAAYFAVEKDWDSDGTIWFYHAATLVNHTADKFHEGSDLDMSSPLESNLLINPSAPHEGYAVGSKVKFPRLIAQQGEFFLSTNVLADYEGVILEAMDASEAPGQILHRKLIIPHDLKPIFLTQLATVNITAAALFPGIDGLGRSVSETARLLGIHQEASEDAPET